MKAQVLSRRFHHVFIVVSAVPEMDQLIPARLTKKINFLMFGVELKVVRAVFLRKPSLGSPRLRLGPDVPYMYSFVARSGLKFG